MKVETIGDCYWCSSDIKKPTENDAVNMINMAIQMLQVVKRIKPKPHLPPLSLRIGIHVNFFCLFSQHKHRFFATQVGRVLGGVIGTKMPRFGLSERYAFVSHFCSRYHLFGTNVLIAQSMESHGVVDSINVSGDLLRRIPVGMYRIVEREPLEVSLVCWEVLVTETEPQKKTRVLISVKFRCFLLQQRTRKICQNTQWTRTKFNSSICI